MNIFLWSATPLLAVLPWQTSSDSAGSFSNGVSWSGNGVPQPNQSTNVHLDSDVYVSQFSGGGTLILPYIAQSRLETDITATIDISLTGSGSADLVFANRNSYDGGNQTYDGLQLTNFKGDVTSIDFDINFSSPVAGRTLNFSGFNALPLLSGLAVSSLGTGMNLSSYDVKMEYYNIVSAPNGLSPFIPGLQASFDDPAADPEFGASTGDTVFNASQFSGVNNFLVVRGYDNSPGQNNYVNNERQLTYIKSQTWTIKTDSGNSFVNDSEFVLSFDGEQYPNYSQAETVPEPNLYLLIPLSLLSFWRKRKINKNNTEAL